MQSKPSVISRIKRRRECACVCARVSLVGYDMYAETDRFASHLHMKQIYIWRHVLQLLTRAFLPNVQISRAWSVFFKLLPLLLSAYFSTRFSIIIIDTFSSHGFMISPEFLLYWSTTKTMTNRSELPESWKSDRWRYYVYIINIYTLVLTRLKFDMSGVLQAIIKIVDWRD